MLFASRRRLAGGAGSLQIERVKRHFDQASAVRPAVETLGRDFPPQQTQPPDPAGLQHRPLAAEEQVVLRVQLFDQYSGNFAIVERVSQDRRQGAGQRVGAAAGGGRGLLSGPPGQQATAL